MRLIKHRVHQVSELEVISTSTNIQGIECDIRFRGNQPYLNHDIDDGCSGIELEKALTYLKNKIVILNIKETGAEKELIEITNSYEAFPLVLDLPFPALKKLYDDGYGSNVMWRVSEYEHLEISNNKMMPIEWVWLDSFHDFWFLHDRDDTSIWRKSKVCLVSSELQSRPLDINQIVSNDIISRFNISAICTKKPELYSTLFA